MGLMANVKRRDVGFTWVPLTSYHRIIVVFAVGEQG